MTKDWATCTFNTDVKVQQIVYGHRVFDFPKADDAHLLVPVHAYCYEDHFKDKGAQMLNPFGKRDFRITSAYLNGRNSSDETFGPGWHEGRIKINDYGLIKVWHQDPQGDWTKTGQDNVGSEDHFEEIDVMTEVQYDNEMDLPKSNKGEIFTQWRWIKGFDGDWYRPNDVLTLQNDSNNDGDHAKIDFAIDQDDGRFYFYHYVK